MHHPSLPIRAAQSIARLSQRVPRYLSFALFNAAYSGILGLVIPRLSRTALLTGIVWGTFYLATCHLQRYLVLRQSR